MKRVILVAAASIGLAVVPAAATAAVDNDRLDVTFPDSLCGFDGSSHYVGIDNWGSRKDGSSSDAGRLSQTFIADNGRGVIVSFAGHQVGEPPVGNPDGTTTYVYRYYGSQMLTKALGGAVLQQNAGRVDVTVVMDEATHQLISINADAVAGLNPNTTGMPDCSVIGPYLAGN